MRKFSLVLLLSLFSTLVMAQRRPTDMPPPPEILMPSVISGQKAESRLPSAKKPGHYTTKDWRQLLDSLWGPGLPTTTKLSVFDNYWNIVDQTWGGFPNLAINWDSLRNVYRPLVAAGVSRGRFSGILSRLTRELLEWHVGTMDLGIDSTMGYFPDLFTWSQYPNYPTFSYKPGIPTVNINLLFWRTNFGAGVTPVDDSTLVVYSVMPNHPLSLQPGDIILGYDGKRWKQLLKELFDAELPILSSDLAGNWLGSTPEAASHEAKISVGMNWGLFDTIDIVKYPSNDTLHYPTSLLSTIGPPYHIATEQLPVNGVPFPDLSANKLVSWGVITGTTIGYIYGWDWCGRPQGQTRDLFGQAIDDLMHYRKVTGLILDFRTNPGGYPEYANIGFSHLFNVDPTPNFSSAIRVRGSDRYAFTLQSSAPFGFAPTPELFDHPIAVLTGPLCGSSGDYNAFRLRFHPMSRSFGRATSGAYTDFSNSAQYGMLAGPYFCRIDDGGVYSNYNNEGYMIHKPFPVDEEVWLTRNGVAKGEDGVVKRALEWINTLSYAHDVQLAHPSRDTLRVTARTQNPLGHALKITAILKAGLGRIIDSLSLMDDGLHGDSASADGLWGYQYVPKQDDTIHVTLRTDDINTGTSRTLPDAAKILFTRGAMISVDITVMNIGIIHDTPLDTAFFVRNIGFQSDSLSVSLDPFNVTPDSAIAVSPKAFALAPGESQKVTFSVRPGLLAPAFYYAIVTINSRFAFGQPTFRKTMAFQKVTGIAQQNELPKEFALAQNYPNPFNPSTTIRYGLPRASHVSLCVYDILGREVAVLVDDQEEPGFHTATWDAKGMASGVYYYRIVAGEFHAVKSMVLMR